MRFEKTKRIIIIVFSLCMLISVGTISAVAAQETTISGSVVTADPRAQVQMDVCIANNPGVLGLTLEVSYPAELTLTGANAGPAFPSLTLTKPGKFLSPCNFVWDGQEVDPTDIKDGVILTLLFTVSDEAQTGTNLDVTLRVGSGNAVDDDLNPIPITTANGTVKINAAPVKPSITTTSLTEGTVGTYYTTTLAATGDMPITWSISSGSLPAGLTLNGNIISGQPTTKGDFTFTVKASNTNGDVTKSFTITIDDGGGIVTPTQYTLTYDTGGGSEVNSTKHDSGTTVNLTATPTREGYTFTGWYSDVALTIKISSVKMDGNKTIYAGWKQDTTPVNPTPSPTNPFTDVANDAYYYDAVLWAVSHDPQITNGTSATTFSPGATCTRGQVVTFLWRAAGCPEPTGSNNPFADVNADAYYYKAVLWAVEEGITKGTGETTFSPEQACTRGQVVTFLHRFENTPMPGSQANPFTDVKTDAYYYDAVLWAVNHDPQITNGTSATTFNPDATCTRGQIVTFLYRDMK